ncbi:MAG: hypothetical protein JW829_01845 [Pirellulales bacterium]|nr:hypothetical protein [Pirellulales bacterium]
MKFAGCYAVVVGGAMLVQWSVFILTGNVPELQNEPIRIAFHLAGEALTAVLLLTSGAGLLLRKPWARIAFFVSAGMLLYTAIVSPGYFVQQGQWAFLFMFGAVLTLTVGAILTVTRST